MKFHVCILKNEKPLAIIEAEEGDISMNWSYRIKAAREEQKLTREQLVERMKAFSSDGRSVSARTLIAWESGETEPKVTQAIALARALGYQEVSALFEPSAARQLNDIGLSRLEEYRQLSRSRSVELFYRTVVYIEPLKIGMQLYSAESVPKSPIDLPDDLILG